MYRKWIDSVNYAIEGVLHASHTQRHVRLHFCIIIALLLFCFAIGVERRDFIIVTIIATIVIVAEIFNSSIETVVDMVSPHKSEKARIAKDMAAGAVLIGAVSSIITGFYILFPYVDRFLTNGFRIAAHDANDIGFCSALIVIIAVIMLKSFFGLGNPLRGGMPSGHSALSFSVFVYSLYRFDSYVIYLAVCAAALLVSISRIVKKIHSPLEVAVGILVGIVITWGMFQVFL
jgi:diacylglycerol kinase (ATP)